MTFHSPGPDGKDKESSNPYKDGEASQEAGAKEVKAGESSADGAASVASGGELDGSAESGKTTVTPSANESQAQSSSSAVKDNQASAATKSEASENKPGVLETLKESARLTDPEERTLTYINPLSALRLGAAVNVCLLIILLVASIVVYILLGIAGVWENLNALLGDLTGMGSFGISEYFTIVLAVGVVEAVLFTLLAPVVATLYNLAAKLVGGLRITVNKRSE